MAKRNIIPPKEVATSSRTKMATPAPAGKVNLAFVKQVMLTLAVCSIIAILPKLPRHEKLMERITKYYVEAKEIAKISESDLMGSRHGENFAVPNQLEKIAKPTDIFLLPPKDYILYTHKARQQVPNPNNWSNPYIFYYFSDKVRTCPYDNVSLRTKATLALRFDEKVNNWGLVPIKNDTILRNLLKEYEKK